MNFVPGQASISLAPSPELAGPHAKVEAQAELAEQADAPDEPLIQAIARGRARPVQHLAHTLDHRLSGERLDVLCEPVRGRPAGDHRGGQHALAAAAELGHGAGLLLLLIRVDVHFHVDCLDDIQSLAGPAIIVDLEIAVESGCGFQPGKSELAQIPEVHVRVDDRRWGGFCRCRRGCRGEDRAGGAFEKLSSCW